MEKFKQFLYKTKDFLDKYWKVIVICVCVILLMGQCSSCNRDNRVEKYSEWILFCTLFIGYVFHYILAIDIPYFFTFKERKFEDTKYSNWQMLRD